MQQNQVFVQAIKQTLKGKEKKLIGYYLKKDICSCGYKMPFCSCAYWSLTNQEIKPVIYWEKFSKNELIDFLSQRESMGTKLSREDERLLKKEKKNEDQYSITMATEHQSLLEAHEKWYLSESSR